MDLYTLDGNFSRTKMIDKFTSAIWTERYSAPGDVTLVVDPTPDMISTLKEGTYLALEGSKEVMLLDTQLIEDGLLKVTGDSLLGFLRERAFSSVNDMHAKSWYAQGFLPENLITHVVYYYAVVVDGGGNMLLYNGLADYNTGGPLNAIPRLSIDPVSSPHAPVNYSVPHGQVYNVIKQVADTWSLGIRLYLNSATPETETTEPEFDLRFRVYSGTDRSAEIRFSPLLDSLTDVKELRSNKGYKTAAVAWPSDEKINYFGVAMVPGTEGFTGFQRRVLLVWADDVYLDKIAVDPEFVTIEDHNNTLIVLEQRARDALANNNYTKVVDGEVVPQNQFKFDEDYFLGDLVELQGYSEITQKARITEYIRAQDSTGERSYPTVSIID